MTLTKERARIGIVGAGNLGSALAVGLGRIGFTIQAIVSRTMSSARDLARLTSCPNHGESYQLLQECDLVLVAVVDHAISDVVTRLSELEYTRKTTIVAHTSGSHGLEVLNPLVNNRSTRILHASFHPMQTFSGGRSAGENAELLRGIYFGIEAAPEAEQCLTQIVQELESETVLIDKQFRKAYHLGGVIVSNFLVAMFYKIDKLYKDYGLSSPEANQVLTPLVETTLKNLTQLGVADSLSGPAARGDEDVIAAQIRFLEDSDLPLSTLYRELSEVCRQINKEKAKP